MRFVRLGLAGTVLALLASGCAGNAPQPAAPAAASTTGNPACVLDQAAGRPGTPHTRAKLGCTSIGTPVEPLIGRLGNPDKTQVSADGVVTMSWSRSQFDRGVGTMSCTETVAAKGGTITAYRQEGGSC